MTALIALSVAALLANAPKPPVAAPPPAAPPAVTAEQAKAFVTKANEDLKKLWVRASSAEWIKSTYITDDTERNAAAMNEDVMEYLTGAIKESLKFKGLKVDADTERMLYLLRVSQALPAPSDAAKRTELATLAAKLEGMYGKGKYCGKDGKGKCRDLQELSAVLTKGGKYEEQLSVGRLAHHFEGHAPALRATGLALQRRRA